MNYYFLPGTGIFGGIKVGFQFSELMTLAGFPIVVATPDGQAPEWFRTSVAVVSQANALENIGPNDTIFFSLPHDYEPLRKTAAKLVFHCQGTSPLIDPVIADPNILCLSCWDQAHQYMLDRGETKPLPVGISISSCFFYSGEVKKPQKVLYMPRRGEDLMEPLVSSSNSLIFSPLHNLSEEALAFELKTGSYFVATSENEWFGLPALEAMAAGCVVLSVPVLGGMEYLKDSLNAYIAKVPELNKKFQGITDAATQAENARMRYAAMETAYSYHRERQVEKIKKALPLIISRIS